MMVFLLMMLLMYSHSDDSDDQHLLHLSIVVGSKAFRAVITLLLSGTAQ